MTRRRRSIDKSTSVPGVLSPPGGSAKTVVEGWEDDTEPSSEWGGDTGSFSETTDTVDSGDQALRFTGTDSSGQINSSSGLPEYPAKGKQFEFFTHSDAVGSGVSNNLNLSLSFGREDSSNEYYAWVDYRRNDVKLRSRSGGGAPSDVFTIDGALSANTWMRHKVIWDDGTLGGSNNDITIEVYQMGSDTLQGSSTANNNDNNGTDLGVRGEVVSSAGTLTFGNINIL